MFKMTAHGADRLSGTIANTIANIANMGLNQKSLENRGALDAAKLFASEQSGYKSQAEASRLNNAEKRLTDELSVMHGSDDPSVSALRRSVLLNVDNPERVARANQIGTQTIHTQGVIDGGLDAGKVGSAYAATEGKGLYDNVGNTGHSLHKFTGEAIQSNPLLAKLFSDKERAGASADYALANLRNETDPNLRSSRSGGGAFTSTQLRYNADVDAAREVVDTWPAEEVSRVLAMPPMMMTENDKQLANVIARAGRAKNGEDFVPSNYTSFKGFDVGKLEELNASIDPSSPDMGVVSGIIPDKKNQQNYLKALEAFNKLNDRKKPALAPLNSTGKQEKSTPKINSNLSYEDSAKSIVDQYKLGRITKDQALEMHKKLRGD